MEKYIKVLHEIDVYESHSLSSSIIKKLPADTLIRYNREKLREKTHWMEIYLEDETKAFILKNTNDIFLCKEVELNDAETTAFSYESKADFTKNFHELFQQFSS
jgi:hypothetical protein